MRRYLFLEGDPAKLEGWRFTLDRRDGMGPIMWPAHMREGDAAMEGMVLCTPVGDCWQLTCLSNNEETRLSLEQYISDMAVKAGILIHFSAKAFAAAKPTLVLPRPDAEVSP